MKLICCRCNKALGEQESLDNASEVKVKCIECIEQEREEASRFQPMPKSGEKLEVELWNDLKGIVWRVTEEVDELSLWDLAVSGKKFFCSNENREGFEKHLNDIKDDELETTFLYSMSIMMKPPSKSRKKTKQPSEPKGKGQSIHYNCTARLPKDYVKRIFNEKANKMTKFLDIIVESSYKAHKDELMEQGKKAFLSQQAKS